MAASGVDGVASEERTAGEADQRKTAIAEVTALLWVALAMVTLLENDLGLSCLLPVTTSERDDDPWTFAEHEIEQHA